MSYSIIVVDAESTNAEESGGEEEDDGPPPAHLVHRNGLVYLLFALPTSPDFFVKVIKNGRVDRESNMRCPPQKLLCFWRRRSTSLPLSPHPSLLAVLPPFLLFPLALSICCALLLATKHHLRLFHESWYRRVFTRALQLPTHSCQ